MGDKKTGGKFKPIKVIHNLMLYCLMWPVNPTLQKETELRFHKQVPIHKQKVIPTKMSHFAFTLAQPTDQTR